jgi:hypothetical protein
MKLRSQLAANNHPICVKPSILYTKPYSEPVETLIGGRSQSAAALRQIATATTPIKQLKLSTASRPYLPYSNTAGQSTEISSARRQLNLKMPVSFV